MCLAVFCSLACDHRDLHVLPHSVPTLRSSDLPTIGIEGLAPYWFEVEGALFLSDKGDVLARAEGYYDQRITQRLILQPRVELNFAAQDIPQNRIGSGLSTAELGLRLRYEVRRARTEERRGGTEWVSTGRSGWAPEPKK